MNLYSRPENLDGYVRNKVGASGSMDAFSNQKHYSVNDINNGGAVSGPIGGVPRLTRNLSSGPMRTTDMGMVDRPMMAGINDPRYAGYEPPTSRQEYYDRINQNTRNQLKYMDMHNGELPGMDAFAAQNMMAPHMQSPMPNWGTEPILNRPAQVQQPMNVLHGVAQQANPLGGYYTPAPDTSNMYSSRYNYPQQREMSQFRSPFGLYGNPLLGNPYRDMMRGAY